MVPSRLALAGRLLSPGAGALALIALAWLQSPIDIGLPASKVGFHPEPDWLSRELLSSAPPQELSAEELMAFERDGVMPVTAVVPSARVRNLLLEVQGGMETSFHHQWYNNGVMRAFLRDGPLPALAAQALRVESVRAWTMQFEHKEPPGRKAPRIPPDWADGNLAGEPRGANVHNDLDSSPAALLPYVTTWLALQGSHVDMEFLAGSHRANLFHRCPPGVMNLDPSCMDRLATDCNGTRKWETAVGDALIFYGQTFHWTVFHEEPRRALSMRFLDARGIFLEELALGTDLPIWYLSYTPWICAPLGDSPLFPVVFPRNASTLDSYPWPILPRQYDALHSVRKLRWSWKSSHDLRHYRQC